MQGYGDPSIGGLGYGDPHPSSAVAELGYGDPESIDLYVIELETREVYHTGGAEVIISGILFDSLAPYRLSLELNGVQTFFSSGIAGQAFNLYPSRNRLFCYSPPVPVGTYTLTLAFGPNFGQSVSLSLIVRPDHRGGERYQMRRLFPYHYKVGERAHSLAPLDRGTSIQNETRLAMLTDTAGRILQDIGGSTQSITRAYANRGATEIQLETTFDFPDSGRVWIDGELISYTLTTDDRLTVSALKRPIRQGEEVTLYAP